MHNAYLHTYVLTYIHTYIHTSYRFGHRAVFIRDTFEILMYGGMAYQVDQPLALVLTYEYTTYVYVQCMYNVCTMYVCM